MAGTPIPEDIRALFSRDLGSMPDHDVLEYFDYFGNPPEKPWHRQRPVVREMCREGAEIYGEDAYLSLLRFMGNLTRYYAGVGIGSIKGYMFEEGSYLCDCKMPGADEKRNPISRTVCARYVEGLLQTDSFLDSDSPPRVPSFGSDQADDRTMLFVRDLVPSFAPEPRRCAALTICAANLKASCEHSDAGDPMRYICLLEERDVPHYFRILQRWAAAALGVRVDDYVHPTDLSGKEEEFLQVAHRRMVINDQILRAFAAIADGIRKKKLGAGGDDYADEKQQPPKKRRKRRK